MIWPPPFPQWQIKQYPLLLALLYSTAQHYATAHLLSACLHFIMIQTALQHYICKESLEETNWRNSFSFSVGPKVQNYISWGCNSNSSGKEMVNFNYRTPYLYVLYKASAYFTIYTYLLYSSIIFKYCTVDLGCVSNPAPLVLIF